MTKYGGVWIVNGCNNPGHCFFQTHFQVAVYGGYYYIECLQYVAVIVQVAIAQYICFYAFEYFEGRQLFIIRFLPPQVATNS